ncbi:unnamed protein product, partial [Ectocarpus fasciculatus]
AKDTGGAFSGGRQGVPSTRDLHVLVDWTKAEDVKLTQLVMATGEGNWIQKAAVLRDALVKCHYYQETEDQASGPADVLVTKTGRHCFERWTTHLVARLRTDDWIKSEDDQLRTTVKDALSRGVSTDELWREVGKTFICRTGWDCQQRWDAIREVPCTPGERTTLFHAQGKQKDTSSPCDRPTKKRRISETGRRSTTSQYAADEDPSTTPPARG